MTKKWGLNSAFGSYGVTLKNPRWSWSGRSEDGSTVVMTFWQDEFTNVPKRMSYNTFGKATELWTNRQGNLERIENLKWARDRCDGLVRVVITVAEDTKASVRSIRSCHPQPNLRMRILELDETSGEFSAELVT